MRFRWRSGIACYARARRPGIEHGYRRARPLPARSPGSVPFHEIRDHRHWKSSVERLHHAKSKAGSLSCLWTTHQDQHIIHEVSSAIPSESPSSARAWLALPVPWCTARPRSCIYPGSPKSGWSRPAPRLHRGGAGPGAPATVGHQARAFAGEVAGPSEGESQPCCAAFAEGARHGDYRCGHRGVRVAVAGSQAVSAQDCLPVFDGALHHGKAASRFH